MTASLHNANTTGEVLLHLGSFAPLRGAAVPQQHDLVAVGARAARARQTTAVAGLATFGILLGSLLLWRRRRSHGAA